MPYTVTTEHFYKADSKTLPAQRWEPRETEVVEYGPWDADRIAEALTEVMRVRGGRFSGMEEFGLGACDCDGDVAGPCCVDAELGSCRNWMAKEFGEMNPGDVQDFHLEGDPWLSIVVLATPDSDEADDA